MNSPHSPASLPFQPLAGGCRCSQVRFRIAAAPIVTHCCHCRDCQKVSGSAFCVNAMIETEHVHVLQGSAETYQGTGSHAVVRCRDCGVVLWSYHPHFGDAIAFVGVGVLDQGDRLQPEAHYFTRSKHPWVALPHGVPSFTELGYPDKPEAGARIGAVLARRGAAASQ
ncbi:MAG: hypothetical protein RL033_2221 [Pseudomonadota bacterium]|jgi:hypothetical protein